MKTLRMVFSIVLFVLCALPFQLWAQNKEIPITTSSKEALDYFLQGRDKLENFENTAAAQLFDQAIAADSNFAMAYLYRSLAGGGLEVRMSNLEEAVARAKDVSEAEQNYISMVQAAYVGNSLKQNECLNKLLTDFPFDKRVRLEAGNYYYNNKDYQNALAQFAKSAELDALFAPAYNMIGYANSKLSNYDEAANAFRNYIKLNPKSPGGYDSYAELLLTMGMYDNSIAQYNKALEYDPDFSYSLIGLGNNYVFLGDYDTARKYYQQYYDNAPTPGARYDALNLEAVSYVHEGKIEKALSVYHQYGDLAQKENDAYHQVMGLASQGMIYAECGNPQEAMKHYDEAIELLWKSDINQAAKENLMNSSKLWHLYALGANGEFKKAETDEKVCLQNAKMRNNPQEMAFLNSVCGYLDYKKGDINEALKHFSKADPEDPITQYYNALCFQNKGDVQNANRLFQKISLSNVNSLDLALVRNRAFNRQMNNMSYSVK
ncbi:MAG TPA: tetratricopeptide repeat protein [Prolixibacteraceae bacterium]|nr:tetratricopeptide repeat protein [Prolixibacteraceae bacterium]